MTVACDRILEGADTGVSETRLTIQQAVSSAPTSYEPIE
jgi:hypothetical protein